jgi:hypothetical protein
MPALQVKSAGLVVHIRFRSDFSACLHALSAVTLYIRFRTDRSDKNPAVPQLFGICSPADRHHLHANHVPTRRLQFKRCHR